MTMAEGLLQAGTFTHDALFYQGRDEYASEVCSFVRQGVSAGEPVLVAVPGRRLDLVRGALGEAGQAVSFADMAVLGRNPARIIPAIRRFTDSRRPGRTRFVSEPVWPGGPALVSGGSPGVPQRLAHDVKDDFLRLGGRPGLRRADTSLVDVGQQRDVRLALRGHLGHGPPAEHAF